MIEINTNTAMMLYLLVTLTILFGMWFRNHRISIKKTLLPEEHKLHQCEYCHNAYLAKSQHQVTQCPQCKSYNKTDR